MEVEHFDTLMEMDMSNMSVEELNKLKDACADKVVEYYGKQMSEKILMNAGYGACGSVYFNYFDIRIAEAVTFGGQAAIQYIAKRIDEYFNEKVFPNESKKRKFVIYSDTDSVYIRTDYLVEKFCKGKTDQEIVDFLDNLFSKAVESNIAKFYDEFANKLNCKENRMFMDREVIASSAIWTGKKNYCMHVLDNEGVRYDKPKSKIMGLHAVRSTCPDNCRDALKKCYDICLNGTNDELIDYVKEFRKHYMSLDIEEQSNSSSCNNIEDYDLGEGKFKKKTPYHVKAAINYNWFVEKNGLENKLDYINSGDSIKMIPFKEQNPYNSEMFGYPAFFPRGYGLEKYIDKQMAFQKAFLKPLENILKVIGWGTKRKISLFG